MVLFLLGIFFLSKKWKNDLEVYKYYRFGLFFKMGGAVAFCLIYALYYGGGDTTDYFIGISAMIGLAGKNFDAFWEIMKGANTPELYSTFDTTIGYPEWHHWRDPYTFIITRITMPFAFLGLNRFLIISILLGTFSFIGVWRLYTMFVELYPKLKYQFAIAILYFPSAIFWGSGIMKDTYTLSAVCWLTYNVYKAFIKKEKVVLNIILGLINIVTILAIKPYIFVSLIPCVIFWILYQRVAKIKSQSIRLFSGPFVIISVFGAGLFLFNILGSQLGDYGTIDGVIKKAIVTQQDLVRTDLYGGNNFDIGKLDGTFFNLITKLPTAIIAGLYRPFLFEARSIVMLISAIENTLLLYLTLVILIKGRIFKTFNIILSDPLILLCFLFPLIFAFSIGISTANFGALVRYKIPLIPFFVSGLYIVKSKLSKVNVEHYQQPNTVI